MNFSRLKILLLLILIVGACSKDGEKDMLPPVINMDQQPYGPLNCDTLIIGEVFTFRALFADNVELGSYSLSAHHNFDHHSHSTDISNCELDEVKVPVNPFLFIEQYNIPAGLTQYESTQTISIPADVDEGDYHIMVRLTDRTGWQTIKGISVKLVRN